MAVKIRLSRIGTTNRPFYRIIATDSRSKRDGESLANIGTYDPFNSSVITFCENVYLEWLSKGAIATDSAKKVYHLFKKAGSVSSAVAAKPVAHVEAAPAEKAEHVA